MYEADFILSEKQQIKIKGLETSKEFRTLQKVFSRFDIPNFSSGLKKQHKGFVATTLWGEVVGGIIFEIKKHHCVVISIAVRRDYQRKKIGTTLIKTMENYVIVKVKRIEVRVPGDERRNFYKSLGYKPYKFNYYQNWLGFIKKISVKINSRLGIKLSPQNGNRLISIDM